MSSSNIVFLEELLNKYLDDPSSVSEEWQDYFNNIESNKRIFPGFQSNILKIIQDEDNEKIGRRLNCEINKKVDIKNNDANHGQDIKNTNYEFIAREIINLYRNKGHFLASLDPLNLEEKQNPSDLGLEFQDLPKEIYLKDINNKSVINKNYLGETTFQGLIKKLKDLYCGNTAYEFSHIQDENRINWIVDIIENRNNLVNFSNQKRKDIISDLIAIEGFENYLHKKFPGAKRFSVEGAESSVACLEHLIRSLSKLGADEIVFGMAHRGRLSTLSKILKKPYYKIIAEFMGKKLDLREGSGDVKYHMGYSNDVKLNENDKIKLTLAYNPSHLESVNCVVAGKVKAMQDEVKNEYSKNKYVGILIHGDAAFCGQGVVTEGLLMSGLESFDIGGTIHIVVNNQVGFTANHFESRKSRYCTDIAKSIGAPIIHVNGDYIEEVIKAVEFAALYRNKFQEDIVIDIVSYRKYGHNEGDEPLYTQPIMYKVIKNKRKISEIYRDYLIELSEISHEFYDKIKLSFNSLLNEEYERASKILAPKDNNKELSDSNNIDMFDVKTGSREGDLDNIVEDLCKIPEDFDINNKIKNIITNRQKLYNSEDKIDWALAENLSYATLLKDNYGVRITGQDSVRGTFSHRHSAYYSQENGNKYVAMNNIRGKQGEFVVTNSNLSEYGVLAFEYGYSLYSHNKLVVWEAQFGDFANGAQIIIDQFIASGESKWGINSGIVLFLPHGYEGQGPEHSSARLERFLQLCASNNMRVMNLTSPASLFHALRSQILSKTRKPLIIMSPKSLLRHKRVLSHKDDFNEGKSFKKLIKEEDLNISKGKIDKLLICSGKIYYDLIEQRESIKKDKVAIIRLEQLYPFPKEELINIIKSYEVNNISWVQEEHKNMGAWFFVKDNILEAMRYANKNFEVTYVGRDHSASPATGYIAVHKEQQDNLLKRAFS